MRWFLAPFDLARGALLGSFAPEAGAPPRVVRVHGAITLLVGLGLFVLGGAGMLWLHGPRGGAVTAEKLLIVPVGFGYVGVIVGGYRLLTGTEPRDNRSSTLASIRRITLGVVTVVLSMALLFGLLLLVGLAFGLQ